MSGVLVVNEAHTQRAGEFMRKHRRDFDTSEAMDDLAQEFERVACNSLRQDDVVGEILAEVRALAEEKEASTALPTHELVLVGEHLASLVRQHHQDGRGANAQVSARALAACAVRYLARTRALKGDETP